jgi:hypothetical protein
MNIIWELVIENEFFTEPSQTLKWKHVSAAKCYVEAKVWEANQKWVSMQVQYAFRGEIIQV